MHRRGLALCIRASGRLELAAQRCSESAAAASAGVHTAVAQPSPVRHSTFALWHAPLTCHAWSGQRVTSRPTEAPLAIVQVFADAHTLAATCSAGPDVRWERSAIVAGSAVARSAGYSTAGYSTVVPGQVSDRAPDDASDAGLIDTTLSHGASVTLPTLPRDMIVRCCCTWASQTNPTRQ